MFALSNFGSLLGLVAFPFLVEPLLGSHGQAVTWSLVYLVFVAGCAWSAWQCRHGAPTGKQATQSADSGSNPESPLAGSPAIWLGLSALGVVLLLATTNQLQQNVASAPFLWVLPLALYLFSFVVVFEGRGGRGWYSPRWGMPLALMAALLMAAGLSVSSGVLDVSLAVPL